MNCEDASLRERNLHIVQQYMQAKDADRLERWKLFSEDATSGLQYTASGAPSVVEGREAIRRKDQSNAAFFPEWSFSDCEYYFGEDADHILVECNGEGVSLLLGKDHPVRHREHYIHKFILRGGEIVFYREYMNPCQEMLELGLTLPSLPADPTRDGAQD